MEKARVWGNMGIRAIKFLVSELVSLINIEVRLELASTWVKIFEGVKVDWSGCLINTKGRYRGKIFIRKPSGVEADATSHSRSIRFGELTSIVHEIIKRDISIHPRQIHSSDLG